MKKDSRHTRRGLRLTIRLKLLILSISILGIPYIGYEYMHELERYLRSSLESSLMDTAQAIAGPLHENYQLFPYLSSEPENALFIHNIKLPIQVDGYTDDWINYLDWLDSYHVAANEGGDGSGTSLSYKLILGQRDQYLYILLQVRDDTIIYHQPSSDRLLDSDYVEMVIGNNYQVTEKIYFSPSAPGRFNPYRVETITQDWDEKEYIRYITNIAAEWQPSKDGYNLEIAMPLYMVSERMGFVVGDVDDNSSRLVVNRAGSAGVNTGAKPGRLVKSSENILNVIRRFNHVDGRRIWVLDSQRQVLASAGDLKASTRSHPLNVFYKLILPSVSERFKDELAGASRLQGGEISAALKGQTASLWRVTPDDKAVIVSATTPVWIGNQVRGIVMVEETTNNIQLLQRNALVSLVNKTLIVFSLITLALLIFATRLSFRLQRLSEAADKAIDDHGRVIGTMPVSTSTDEIGDMSRNYASMLERLHEYNIYLEGLASKLSHELRTPMVVVQTSLENLRSATGAGAEVDPVYLERAEQGIQRLQALVTRLSEAARLEQALQTAETSNIDLDQLIRQAVEGYRQAYPDQAFRVSLPEDPLYADISPDIFMQMMDNIISNAVDFNHHDKPIRLLLDSNEESITLDIINYGSRLPEEMEGQLFNSMVSVREHRTGSAHLGLGLYIARLVAEFHKGRIRARNLTDEQGVCFSILLER